MPFVALNCIQIYLPVFVLLRPLDRRFRLAASGNVIPFLRHNKDCKKQRQCYYDDMFHSLLSSKMKSTYLEIIASILLHASGLLKSMPFSLGYCLVKSTM